MYINQRIICVHVLSVPLGSLNNWTPTIEQSECVGTSNIGGNKMSNDFYNVSDEAREVINQVIDTLDSAINDKRVLYPVTIDKGNGEINSHFEYREQHLQSTIEWAIDYIGGNIDIDGDSDEQSILGGNHHE